MESLRAAGTQDTVAEQDQQPMPRAHLKIHYDASLDSPVDTAWEVDLSPPTLDPPWTLPFTLQERTTEQATVLFIKREILLLACLCTLRIHASFRRWCCGGALSRYYRRCPRCSSAIVAVLRWNFPDYEIDEDVVDGWFERVARRRPEWMTGLRCVDAGEWTVAWTLRLLFRGVFRVLFPSGVGPEGEGRSLGPGSDSFDTLDAFLRWGPRESRPGSMDFAIRGMGVVIDVGTRISHR